MPNGLVFGGELPCPDNCGASGMARPGSGAARVQEGLTAFVLDGGQAGRAAPENPTGKSAYNIFVYPESKVYDCSARGELESDHTI